MSDEIKGLLQYGFEHRGRWAALYTGASDDEPTRFQRIAAQTAEGFLSLSIADQREYAIRYDARQTQDSVAREMESGDLIDAQIHTTNTVDYYNRKHSECFIPSMKISFNINGNMCCGDNPMKDLAQQVTRIKIREGFAKFMKQTLDERDQTARRFAAALPVIIKVFEDAQNAPLQAAGNKPA